MRLDNSSTTIVIISSSVCRQYIHLGFFAAKLSYRLSG